MNLKGKQRVLIFLLGCLFALTFLFTGCSAPDNSGKSTDKPKAEVVNEDENSEAAPQPETEMTSLKESYQNDFLVGVAINRRQLEQSDVLSLVKQQFNSLTMENEMKPENLLDQEASEKSDDGMPCISTDNLDKILKIAKDNNFQLRGHCLVWHNQTPDWFFRKDYDDSEDYVDKDTMLKRMENYIKKVMEFCQAKYPGVVYAWDVVNEGTSDDGGYRQDNSNWYTIIGKDYIEKAFEYARKYADKDVKLFYNDYNCYEDQKRDFIKSMVEKLKEKGIIDGIGMQTHIGMDYPDVSKIQDAIETFSTINGIEIQLTEIDMHNPSNSEDALTKQAERYKNLFKMLLQLDRNKTANITSVTFWGLTDEDTWLTNFKGVKSYPLLFDGNYEPKKAFTSIIEAALNK